MNKTLDRTFMHYGIRSGDLEIIRKVCDENDVNFEWLKEEILREYHSRKMRNEEMTASNLHKLINNALNKQQDYANNTDTSQKL